MYTDRLHRTLATCIALLTLAACDPAGNSAPDDKPAALATSQKSSGGGKGTTAPKLAADANVHSMNLTWNDDGVSQYTAYVSSSPDCDTSNYSLCPDGQMFVGVRSPYKVAGLENGRVYYAKVETTTTTRKSTTTTLVSNVAGARPTTLEFNDSVRTIVAATDGTKYLGGDFTRIGLTSGQAVPLDAATGKPSVPGFPMIAGEVEAAAPDGTGGWYVGGDFQRVGNVARAYLVHVRYDGTVDTAWNPVPDGSVWAIAVMNGVVYIGGRFSTINGQMRTGVAAIEASTGQLMAWNPNPDLGVWTLAAANGTIYMGGTFTTVGAFRRSHVAAVDTYGNVLPWDPNADGTVDALAVSGSTVYVGGFFDNVGGQPRAKLAAVDATAGKPTAWNASLTCTACEVRSIAVSGTTVYVGGRFTQIKGVARNHVAAVDAATGNVLAWNPNAEYTVRSLAVIKTSTGTTTVYAGGEFTRIGGQPYAYLAALDSQGAALATWQPAPIANVDVVVAAGTQVMAGGRFTGLGAVVRNYAAAIDATGALKPWNPNANGSVLAMDLTGNNLYLGGNFTSLGGQPRAYLAMVDTTGNVGGWNPGTNRPVLALARGTSGTLYVGGEFYTVAGTPRGRLAAFDVNGALLGWAPNADYEVRALAVGPYLQSGETVYVGGRFGMINGQMRRRIAQLDQQGQLTAWNPWGANLVGDYDVVNALRYGNGLVYAGGLFAQLGRNVAEITETGVINKMQGADLQVWSLALAGTKLTIGGDFTMVLDPVGAPTLRSRVATIDTATRTVTAFAPSLPAGTVFAVAPEGTSMHVGGSFTQVNDQIVSGFATL